MLSAHSVVILAISLFWSSFLFVSSRFFVLELVSFCFYSFLSSGVKALPKNKDVDTISRERWGLTSIASIVEMSARSRLTNTK